MTDRTGQGERIEQVDRLSELDAAARPGAGETAPAFFLRLVAAPAAVLLRSLILRGGLIGGRSGVTRSVNDWARAFAAEAKRYERFFKNDPGPV